MSKSTVGTFKHTVWKSCAIFIKLRDSDSNGWCRCCTCDKPIRYDEPTTQAGHYVPGHNNSTYFNDAIIHSQCYSCNHYGRGEQGKYGLFLKKKYGYTDEILEELLQLKHKTRKITMEDLEETKKTFDMASEMLRKVKGLE